MGPRAVLDGRGNLAATRIQYPERPALRKSCSKWKMGAMYSTQGDMKKVFDYLVHFVNLGVDGRIILRWIFTEIRYERLEKLKGKQATTREFRSAYGAGC
jgi:hypothetical protein